MADPALEWTLSMAAPPFLRLLNAVEAALPLWTWRVGALRRFREAVARYYLGYGAIDLAFTAASGHDVVLLARRNYRIETAAATLEGRSLGEPTTLEENPTIAGVRLPTVPSFVFGQAQAAIQDRASYERLRETVRER